MKTTMMKGSRWIFVFFAAIICLLLLVWQGKEVSGLEDELEREREAVAAMGNSPIESGVQNEVESAVEGISSSAGAAQQSSPVTVSHLLAIMPDESQNSDPAGLIRLLPDILALLEDLSVDELFVLLEELHELSKDKSEAKSGRAESIVGVLFLLLSDVEPERILTFLEGEDQDSRVLHEIQSSALFSLARQDPAKAEAYLKASDWRGRLRQQGEFAVFGGLVQVDFEQALRYLEETNLNSGQEISVLANAGRDPAVRSQMRAAVVEMKNSPMKKRLSTALMAAEFTAGGFEGVSQLLSGMTFATPEERDEAISGAANMGLVFKPQETIEWLKKEASSARIAECLSNSIMGWARQDYEAAGEWLKTQNPSSDTDHAISAYASTVVQIAPEAAMVWAEEIQDPKMQENTQKRTLREWHEMDPAAAESWLTEQGWDVGEWITNLE